jgi:hypothetical protein
MGTQSFGLGDAFVASFDQSGAPRWTYQWGSAGNDSAFDVAWMDGERVAVAGYSDVPGSGGDAMVAVIDGSRASPLVWQVLPGSMGLDRAFAVAYDAASATVFASGYTGDALAGGNLGMEDAWVAAYDANTGTLRWITQFGTAGDDGIMALALTTVGGVRTLFGGGFVGGSLDGKPFAGGTDDNLVVRIDPTNGRRL